MFEQALLCSAVGSFIFVTFASPYFEYVVFAVRPPLFVCFGCRSNVLLPSIEGLVTTSCVLFKRPKFLLLVTYFLLPTAAVLLSSRDGDAV